MPFFYFACWFILALNDIFQKKNYFGCAKKNIVCSFYELQLENCLLKVIFVAKFNSPSFQILVAREKVKLGFQFASDILSSEGCEWQLLSKICVLLDFSENIFCNFRISWLNPSYHDIYSYWFTMKGLGQARIWSDRDLNDNYTSPRSSLSPQGHF